MKPVVIAIAGGSGSGKSWLAGTLAMHFGDAALRVCQDDFYRDRQQLTLRERRHLNFDHPRALDWNVYLRALRCWSRGRPAPVPSYDFTRSTRRPGLHRVPPRPLVIVEGLWPFLMPEVRPFVHLAIFLECPAGLRLRNRLRRDLRERGRSATAVRRQFRSQVQPMHRQFVEPQRNGAHVVVPGPVGSRELRRLMARLEALVTDVPPAQQPPRTGAPNAP